jgi:hypothetical protein
LACGYEFIVLLLDEVGQVVSDDFFRFFLLSPVVLFQVAAHVVLEMFLVQVEAALVLAAVASDEPLAVPDCTVAGFDQSMAVFVEFEGLG